MTTPPPQPFADRISMDSPPIPEAPAVRIQKLTVRYDEREDRLLLAAQCENGQTQGLWLTQRLANPLIQVLLKRLGDMSAEGKAAHQQAALQVWEQAAAHRQYHADDTEPVNVSPDGPHGLIDTVNVVCHFGGDFHLIFRWPSENSLVFPMTATAMRQWLGILRQQYRRADWPGRGLWPAWFEAAQLEHTDEPAVMH